MCRAAKKSTSRVKRDAVSDEERPVCTFFRLLWSCDDCRHGDASRQQQQQRAWVTEQKHVSGSPTYDSRKYVIAKPTRIVLVHQYASMC